MQEVDDDDTSGSDASDSELAEVQKIHGNQLISVDGTKWNVQSSDITQRGRHKSENVFSAKAGPKNKARMQIIHESAKSALMLLIDNEMLQEILNCTVKEAKAQGNYQWELTAEELLAFMGLVYVRGFIGVKNIPLDDLCSKDWGNRLFSETMPRNRFREILRFIRFDDRHTPEQQDWWMTNLHYFPTFGTASYLIVNQPMCLKKI